MAQPTPHLLYGTVEDHEGAFPPAANLEFCVTLRPGEPTEQTLCFPTDPDLFGWEYIETTGYWRAECAEFDYWNIDDLASVYFSITEEEIVVAEVTVEIVLNESPAQNLGTIVILPLENTPPVIDEECLPIATDEDMDLIYDLTDCATDLEDLPEDLNWEVTDWDDGIWASVEIVDNELTMTLLADANGDDEVTFTVTDNGLLGDDELFDTAVVTISVSAINDAPLIDEECLPTATDEDNDLVYDLTDCATDLEDLPEDLNWEVTDWDDGIWASVEIVDNELTMTLLADANGDDEVTFTVTDNGEAGGDELTDTAVVTISVSAINDAPVIDEGCLPVATDEDIDLVQDLTACATDVEDAGADLNWEIADWDDTLWESVEIVDNTLTMVPISDVDGDDEVTFTVTDNGEAGGDELTDDYTYTISIIGVNDPPTIELPDTLAFDEDTILEVDFEQYLFDIETPESLILTVEGNDQITVDIDVFLVTFSTPEHWFGSEEITFTIDDQDLRLTDSDMVTVVVAPINDAPVLDEDCLPTATDEDVDLEWPLTLCATDIEDDQADLNWEISDWDDSLWESVEIVDNLLTMVPIADVDGDDEVTFTVTDNGEAGGDELTDDYTYTISIIGVNDPPTITLPDTLAFDEDTILEVDFEQYLFDIETPESLILTVEGNDQITVDIDVFMVTFSAPEHWFGSEEITFTIDDQDLRLTDSDMVTVVVNSVNDLPVIDEECLVLETDEDVTLVFDLTECANDIEDADTNLVWTVADWDTSCWASFAILENVLTAMPHPDVWGPDTVSFTVTDLDEGSDVDTVTVMINCILDFDTVTEYEVYRGSELLIELGYDLDCGTPVLDDSDLPDWLILDEIDGIISGTPTTETSPQEFDLTLTLDEEFYLFHFTIVLLGDVITEEGAGDFDFLIGEGGVDGYLRFHFDNIVDPPYYLSVELIEGGAERTLDENMSDWIWEVRTNLANDIGGYAELYMPNHLEAFMNSLSVAESHLYFYQGDTQFTLERQAETEANTGADKLTLVIPGLENSFWSFGAYFEDVTANKLWQNFPNPFNDVTRIGFDITADNTTVEVTIYNAVGEKIWEDSGVFDRDWYRDNFLTWNGRNSLGLPVGSGVYIIRAKIDGEVFTKQTVFLRGN